MFPPFFFLHPSTQGRRPKFSLGGTEFKSITSKEKTNFYMHDIFKEFKKLYDISKVNMHPKL